MKYIQREILNQIDHAIPEGAFFTLLVSTPLDSGIDTNIQDRATMIAYLRETADFLEATDKPWEIYKRPLASSGGVVEAFDALAKAAGNHWDGIDDEQYVKSVRGD